MVCGIRDLCEFFYDLELIYDLWFRFLIFFGGLCDILNIFFYDSIILENFTFVFL